LKKRTGKKTGKRGKAAKNKQADFSEYRKKLNPLIIIQEQDGESLYAVVDFSLPNSPEVRRIISKRHANGNISAVTYIGEVGAARTCISKRGVMTMENVTPERFWDSVRILELLYRARGATVSVSRYDGKTMREAAELMKSLDTAQVWIDSECDRINL